jgi:hypothetical protein
MVLIVGVLDNLSVACSSDPRSYVTCFKVGCGGLSGPKICSPVTAANDPERTFSSPNSQQSVKFTGLFFNPIASFP